MGWRAGRRAAGSRRSWIRTWVNSLLWKVVRGGEGEEVPEPLQLRDLGPAGQVGQLVGEVVETRVGDRSEVTAARSHRHLDRPFFWTGHRQPRQVVAGERGR